MKKLKAIAVVMTLFFLGGCGALGNSSEEEPKRPAEMDPEDLPQVDAFQKEFSRQFMESIDEVEEGYYLMRSGIDAFTIYFPEDATLMENGYGYDGNHFEKLRFAYESEKENRGYTLDFQYNYGGNANHPEWKLDGLRKKWGFNDEWKELEDDEGTTFYGTFVEETKYGEDVIVVGYKVSKNDVPQAMEFSQMVSCVNMDVPSCKLDHQKEESFVLEWVKSITFMREGGSKTDE
ncbi:hypothetical protein [Bacillus sp. JCM 19041]|uniref:hypothetical protein n=1 Tax=Bacillus sp. JCM 19041 TaxID=1460637 RepID=UPI0006CFCA06